MMMKQISSNRSNTRGEQGPTSVNRRTLIGGAMAALLASQGRAIAEDTDARDRTLRGRDALRAEGAAPATSPIRGRPSGFVPNCA